MFLFSGLNEMVQDDLISYLKGVIILINDLILLIIISFIFVIIHELSISIN
jgi:hypothetical protein